MTKPDSVFLTDNRRDVLFGKSDWTEASINNERSRIKNRAEIALDELIAVASSPMIDNADVFEEEQVRTLLSILLYGTGGFRYEDLDLEEVLKESEDYHLVAWEPDTDYANSLYVAVDGTLRGFHEQDEDREPRNRD